MRVYADITGGLAVVVFLHSIESGPSLKLRETARKQKIKASKQARKQANTQIMCVTLNSIM